MEVLVDMLALEYVVWVRHGLLVCIFSCWRSVGQNLKTAMEAGKTEDNRKREPLGQVALAGKRDGLLTYCVRVRADRKKVALIQLEL